GGIGSSTNDIPAHALKHRVAVQISDDFTILITSTEVSLHFHKIRRKPDGLIIWKVFSLSQSDSDCFYPCMLLYQDKDVTDGISCIVTLIEVCQYLDSQFLAFLHPLALR